MTIKPEVSMRSAERDRLIAHLVTMRNTMLTEGHRGVAAWANDRVIELVDERNRQAEVLRDVQRQLDT
jgi:hypothetical protein